MSQLSHQRWEHPSDAHAHAHAHHHQPQQQPQYQDQAHPVHGPPHTPVSPTHASQLNFVQDSPTMGRPQTRSQHSSPIPSPIAIAPQGAHASGSTTLGSSPSSPLSSTGARFRKPAPSPLHNTTAISPPNSPSPTKPKFNVSFGAHGSPITSPTTPSVSEASTKTDAEPISPRQKLDDDLDAERSYYHSDSSGTETPEDKPTPRPAASLRFPNDSRSVSDPVKKPLGLSTTSSSQATMPGSSRMDDVKTAPRNSSIDSAISAISVGSSGPKNSQDGSSSPADISNLIKAAGSPEAVIQYLLKEKQSQSQQNSQLWRLVDKQRAMILGLNKDLERALKDKEKYRKKLKEVMALQTIPQVPSGMTVTQASDQDTRAGSETTKKSTLDISASPSVESERTRHSPIDVSLAPYPLTPPADRYTNGSPSAVGEILDPSHAMPEASEHALDHFDHEAQERAAEEARKQADAKADLPISLTIPPSRSLPNQPPPPQGAPPAPPAPSQRPHRSDSDNTTIDDDGISSFPSPPLSSPRKAPPAPLQLKQSQSSPTFSPDEEADSDSDYDDILEVDEITVEKRGRRRTRQEDNEMREILALKEAEARSVSKKSNQSSSAKGGPEETVPEIQLSTSSPHASPGLNRPGAPGSLGSLAGMLRGDTTNIATPLLSPGLPSTPRPMPVGSGPNSPPLSPRYNGFGMPLSPRAPRQPIPLPPNTPLETPSRPTEQLALRTPQPLNMTAVAAAVEPQADSPSSASRDSATERTKVYKGFITEEFPDLLLPPNALPSIILKVASSRMKPSRASLISLTQLEEDPVFTLAVHSRADGGELWRVEKDSTSLVKLDQRLKQCPAVTARTPDRSLFSGHAPAKLDARRQALDQYLDELLNTPLDIATAVELCRYLSTNVLPPNADEMGSSTGPSDEGAPRMGPGGRQYRSGYLTKRGKNFGGWKARFFACEGPQLKYYETPGGAHLGTIKLPGAQIGRQSHHSSETSSPARVNDEMDNQYRHAFLILEPKKKDPNTMTKHLLCAESDRERDQWVQVLLQWTNYREGEEDNKRDHAHDRQGSGQSHSRSGANSKKKTHGRPQQHQPKDSEDALIGVSYEATRAGDVPTMGSSAPNQPEPSPTSTMNSQQLYSISAPRDPQVISDMSIWGNKMSAPTPLGMDEKKAKKRSFFGFGPKQRSSSDGTDSLGENAGMSGQTRDTYSGPIRRVFGAPLAEAVRYNSPRDIRIPLPAVVYRCIQYLDARGAVTEEGIFRLSGSNLVIKQLKERFDNEGDINLLEDEQYHDIHAIASMLKAYLRELPTSILTRDLHLDFVAVTEMSSQAEKIVALSELVPRLPQANATLLKYLIAFLIKVINHADQNKMTVRNVGIVFSPTLTIPAPVFALFLQNYEAIFGIVPEEYELPSPASFEEQRERRTSLDLPPRPSTSGGIRESPHRHRLAEALQEGRRGNTPPPAGLASHGVYSQARTTPTPPLAQARSYDPTYFQQGPGSSHGPVRQAYEGMLVAPGFDPNLYHAAQQRVVSPGFGGPNFENGATYDQNVRASRRESSIMMGIPRGLTPQSSMGRLTEES
ncbi:GTPase-activating protein BEM3 [Cytospora mali]|uniref:GTPase-activating protein BEM3 n=1 Tax=Cytospora mali TaxID=578113 RepID=A0A194V0V1_CYTMA|nr:GTPase-activating protein BEM3 [Valsa mali var. pyri (nom. inval.)]